MAQWLRNQRRKCTQCQVQHQKQHPILEVEINTNVRAIIEFMAKSEQHYTKVRTRTQVKTGFNSNQTSFEVQFNHYPSATNNT